MKFFHWRAWDKGKTRICDCGWVAAESKEHAMRLATTMVGGPYVDQITMIQLDEILTLKKEQEGN